MVMQKTSNAGNVNLLSLVFVNLDVNNEMSLEAKLCVIYIATIVIDTLHCHINQMQLLKGKEFWFKFISAAERLPN